MKTARLLALAIATLSTLSLIAQPADSDANSTATPKTPK